jgi:cbb3-type cytochrome c oxidase subunit II
VAGVWVFAGLMTLVLPIVDDTDRNATLIADTYRTYDSGSAELAGRNLYISEGCIECHTQAVRPVGPDVGLGPVSVAGDYANETPALLGAARFGPDLMHFASNVEFFDKVLVEASLRDPRALKPWSIMPSYSYLSSEDLGALVSYIETLR